MTQELVNAGEETYWPVSIKLPDVSLFMKQIDNYIIIGTWYLTKQYAFREQDL